MLVSKRYKFHLLILVVCLFVGGTNSAVINTGSKSSSPNKKNEQPPPKDEELQGSHTIVRPTHIYKTKEEADKPTIGSVGGGMGQRDLRPFEWLYKHLSEYLMCSYAGHKDCEHKLAGAISMEELNEKMKQFKQQQQQQQKQQMPMQFGPQGPMPAGPFGSPMMWIPAGGPPGGPKEEPMGSMGPGKSFQIMNYPSWTPKHGGPMGPGGPGPQFFGPPGPGPMEFDPKKGPMMPFGQGPPGSQFDGPQPVLLSMQSPEMHNGLKMTPSPDMTAEKKKDSSEIEKEEPNKWKYSNAYAGMMPFPMFGAPAFVAQ